MVVFKITPLWLVYYKIPFHQLIPTVIHCHVVTELNYILFPSKAQLCRMIINEQYIEFHVLISRVRCQGW